MSFLEKKDQHLDWVSGVREGVYAFLQAVGVEDYYHFRYSLSGDLHSPGRWGLANAVYATKILYVTDLLDRLTETERHNVYRKIVSFSRKDGYIYDPLLTKPSFKERIKQKVGRSQVDGQQIEQTKRAETRQSFAALYLLGRKPNAPFLGIPYTEEKINDYLSSLDWQTPWGAASHFSHLLFFLRMNAELFAYQKDKAEALIEYAIQWVNKFQSKDDGAWYAGSSVSLVQKINGAMKIITGLHAANVYDFAWARQLIDTALMSANDQEACSHFNVVYVLYGCQQIEPSYRASEIEEFLYNRLALYQDFYHLVPGGFSFFKGKAETYLYGKRLTRGKNEPDIHGTIMFVWGLAFIDKMLGLGLGFKIPVN